MNPASMSLKFTLTRHTSAVNALAISPHGSLLLSGGSDSRVVVWNLHSGEMQQEICVPSAGFISCLVWVKVAGDEDIFVFGASDGNVHLYQRTMENPVFSFLSITLAHNGAIESLEWDPHHQRLASVGDGEVRIWKFGSEQKSFVSLPAIIVEKQPYIARSVHFLDEGSSILVSYLESGYVCCYSIDPWDLKWKKKTNSRIGDTCLDGNHLLVSNLRDGVDKYAIPTLHRVQSYHHAILVNVPLQIAVAREAGWVIVGGDNGFARVFDSQTGTFRDKLDHGGVGDPVVAVAAAETGQGCIIATGSARQGHNNIKVWIQSIQVVTGRPTANTAQPRSPWSFIMQILLFAAVCVFINILMASLPSSLLSQLSYSMPGLTPSNILPKQSAFQGPSSLVGVLVNSPVSPSSEVPYDGASERSPSTHLPSWG